MLSSNKLHYHPRLSIPNLKTTVVRLLHGPKFQIFFTESNMMVNVVRYLLKSEAIFFKVGGQLPKKKTHTEMFSCDVFQYTLFVKHAWLVTASAKYHILCYVDLISKMLLSTGFVLIVFKSFQNKRRESLMNNCFSKL